MRAADSAIMHDFSTEPRRVRSGPSCPTVFPILLTFLNLIATSAVAQRPIVVEVDNDALNVGLLGEPSDGEYTHGMRLILPQRGRSPIGRWVMPEVAACGREAPARTCQDWSLILGQEIYTPGTSRQRYRPTRRPFAGWLGASIRTGIHSVRFDHEFTAAIGVTGAASLSEPTQRWFHEMLAQGTSTGWSEQLLTEATVGLAYRGALTPAQRQLGRFSMVSIRPVWGAALGTVRTELSAGLEGALVLVGGWRSSMPSVANAGRSSTIYLLGGITGRWVGSDLFLDGGFFRRGRSVGHESLVYVTEVGAGIQLQDRRIEWRVVRTSRRYATQPEPHTYTTLSIVQ